MQRQLTTLTLAAGLCISGAAQATLIDRGGGLIYDDVLNVTWLQNTNLAASNTFGLAYNTDLGNHPNDSEGASYSELINPNGRMTWGAALHWIDAMNTANYLGYSNWRLPTLNVMDTSCSHDIAPDGYYGYHCTDGEFTHLMSADLGVQPGSSVLNTAGDTAVQIANLALFSNVQSDVYWMGMEWAAYPLYAWNYATSVDYQYFDDKNLPFYAWAVRDGDVASPSGNVPEPETLGLIALGLLGLGLARRVAG